MAAITLDIGGNTRQLDRDIQKTVNKVYTINLKTKGDQPLGRITGQVNEFNKSLDASNARVIAFGASAGIIFGVERAFAALVSATIEVQKSLQDINVILNASQANLQKFGAELFGIARNTGQSFQEVAKAATEFSRQGLGIEETLKRTSEALILSRLSGLDAAKSVEALTAAVNSFASQAVTATEVVNKFATVDAAFAVSSADLADAIARVGSSAAQSGVSLNELIAIVTSAQQTTARGGAVIGNSFKTIFTRLQREKVVDLLGSLGISGTDASGQVKSTIQLLQDLGAVYDTLGSQQQAYVAEQVGGVFQINILKAALADLGKEYSIYNSALNVAAGATDQAIRRNEELNKTYSAQINVLKQNATQLAATAGERLIGPAFERVVGGGNDILGGINESDGTGIGASLGKGIMDGLGQFIAGPGLVIFGGVLLKLLRDLGKFATGSIQQLLGLNTAATQQKDIQTSISQILAKNPQLLDLALKGEQGLNTAANSLLASLQKQTAELQKQSAVAAQISKAFYTAGVRVTGGVPVAPTGRAGKAAGYIPNLAEVSQAIELGAPSSVQSVSGVGKIGGKSFQANNKEFQIPDFGGTGETAVIPKYGGGIKEATKMIARGESGSVLDKSDRNRAKGFVPNFAKNRRDYKVTDGDSTINFSDKKQGRLEFVDAIESWQKYGLQAKQEAEKIIYSKFPNTEFLLKSSDGKAAYNRYSFRSNELQNTLIKKGLGVPDIRYSGQNYIASTLQTMQKNIGLWSDKNKDGFYNHPKAQQFIKQNNLEKKLSSRTDISKNKKNFILGSATRFATGRFGGKLLPETYKSGKQVNFQELFASGFIPNFAQTKKAIDLGNLDKIPNELGNKVVSLIYPGLSDGYTLSPATASYLKQEYTGKIPVAGINQTKLKSQLPDLDKNLGDLLVKEANQFGQSLGGSNFLKSAEDLPNYGAAKGAVGVAFEGGVQTLLQQKVGRKQNAGIDFRNITPRLRSIFNEAPGMYDAKSSPALTNEVFKKLLNETRPGATVQKSSGQAGKEYSKKRQEAVDQLRKEGVTGSVAIRQALRDRFGIVGKAAGYIPNFAAPLVRAVDDKELRMMLSKFGKGFSFQNISSDQSALEYFGGSGTYMWDALSRPGEQMSDRQAYKQNIGRAKNWSSARKQSSWLVRYNRSKLKDSELLPDMETGGASVYGLPLSKDQIVWPIKQSGGSGRIFEKDIPAFLSGQVNDAIKRESEAGVPKNQIYLAQEQALTSANPMGLGVFNKQDEPTKGSRKDAMRRKGFARGYIPNFAEDSTSVSSGVAALGIELTGLSYLLSGSRQRYKESFDSMTNANKATKRFAAGADAYGSAIAIGAPILAATIKNAISQTTKTGRGAAAAVTGVGQIASMGATGAQLGLTFGPQGAAVGAALGATAGALLSANDVINGFTSTLPDAQNAYEKASQELTKFNDASALLTKASEALSNALLEAVPNPEKVKKAQDEYADALSGLTEEDRKRIVSQKGDKAQQQEQEKIRSEKIAAERNAEKALKVSQLYEQSSSIGGEGSRLFFRGGSEAEKARAEARRDTLKQSFTGMALQGKQGSDALPVLQKLSEKGGIYDQLMKLGGIDTATGEFTPDKRPLKERSSELKNILETSLPESEFKKGFIADVVSTASTGILNLQGSILTLAEGIQEATYSTNENVESSNAYAQSKTDEAKAVADSIKASQNTINAIQQSIRAAQQQATTERALAQMRAQFATATSYQEKLRSSETAKALVGENAPLTETFTNRAEIENINKTFQDGLDSLTYGIAGDLSNEISDAFKGSVGKTAGTAVGKEGASAEDIQKATAEADVKSNEQIQAFKNLQQILSANIEGNNKLDFDSLKSVFEDKLTEIGIVGEEQNKIISQLESSVLSGNSEIAKLQEKARQSILELSKEATQKILISKITQAQKFAGGIEEYINPPKPGESTFDKAVTATEGFNQFQGQKANFAFDYKKGTNQFRYQGAAAEDERKKQMPEYGRQSLELIGGLQNYFGYTPDESGKAYQAGVSGLKETLDQQVKKFQDIAADSKTPDIVRDEITKGLKEVSALGGTGNIAAIQVAKQTGSLTEEGYKKITGKFNDPVLETLRQQNPELASMKAAEMIVSDDPTVKAINKTNSILTDIRNGSNGSNSSMGNATQKAIQDAVKTSPVSPTAISTTVPKEITAKDSMGNTVRGKEAKTVIARDKKRFEDWSKAGGMGLGPTEMNVEELEKGRYGNLRTSENPYLTASQNDMLDPVLASTKAYRVGTPSLERVSNEKYGIKDLASYNPFSPITYDNAMQRAGEPIQRSNQNINQQSNPTVNLGGINLNINSTAQISNEDFEQLKPKIEQLLQTEVPNMLIEIQNVKKDVSVLGRTRETVDNLLSNGNFTQFAPPPKIR